MAFQQILIEFVDGPLDREGLMENVDTVRLLLHHPSHAPDVPFDGSQTFQGFFSVHATHST
jgi:hypothetical protein